MNPVSNVKVNVPIDSVKPTAPLEAVTAGMGGIKGGEAQ